MMKKISQIKRRMLIPMKRVLERIRKTMLTTSMKFVKEIN
jgi:hypothetical protein